MRVAQPYQIWIVKGLQDYLDPDSDDVADNTVGGADGTGDDIDGTANAALDGTGSGSVDDPTDVDKDGAPDVIDSNTAVFGGIAAPLAPSPRLICQLYL